MNRLLLLSILVVAASVSCKHKEGTPEPNTGTRDTSDYLIKGATIISGPNTISYRFTYTSDYRLDSIFETHSAGGSTTTVFTYKAGYWLCKVPVPTSSYVADSITLNSDGQPLVSYTSKRIKTIYHYNSKRLIQSITFSYHSQGYSVDTANYTYLIGDVDSIEHRTMDDYDFPEPVEVWRAKYFYDGGRPFQMASIPYFQEFRFGLIVNRTNKLVTAMSRYHPRGGGLLEQYTYTYDSLNRITHAISGDTTGQNGVHYDFYY
jgi:hypothetical protein